MTYLKFLFLIIGLCFVVVAKVLYNKRNNGSTPVTSYTMREKVTLYLGYIFLLGAALLAAFNI